MGVSCDMTDAFYVPGRVASEFRDLSLLFAGNHVEVELALSTILDTVEVRADHEVFNHIDGSRNVATFLEDYNRVGGARVLGWAHPFKTTKGPLRDRRLADFAMAEREALFTAPNLTWLRPGGRPEVHMGCLL